MNIVVILSVIPVVIWFFVAPIASRFAGLNSITISLGQILGLVGMSLFSINLILAGRFKWLDKHFKGLDKVYGNHHKIGAIAFSLLLFHPLLLVVKYVAISTKQAAMFFVPFTNMPTTWGMISLTLMIILIIFTFYINFKYHIWKIFHKFMVLAFSFAVLHAFFITSDVSRNNLLRYYILTLAFTGLFIIIRKTFFDYFANNKLKYKIKNVRQFNRDILEVEMEAISKKMIFTPGQFAFFNFLSGNVSSESHPFSISSSINDDNLKITIKNLGDFTSILNNPFTDEAGLKPNDGVLIDGPYGSFSYKNVSNKNQIWVAGGIGITPFYSMAQSLESEYHVDLYYSVKEAKEAVYLKELQDLEQKNPNLKFILWGTSKKGYINGGLISSLSEGLNGKDIFLCGPSLFMESLKEQFIGLGVDIKRIHYENFSL